MILKKYKNQFYDLIVENKLDINIFSSEEKNTKDGPSFIICLKNSPFKFTIIASDYDHAFFYCYFVKLAKGYPEYALAEEVRPFHEIRQSFSGWLEHEVIEYLNNFAEPDLWDIVNNQKPLFSGLRLDKEELEKFDNPEKIQARMLINEFKLLIINNFGPSEQEIEVINDRLDYLTNAVDRLNKVDWKSLAFTTIISISIALSLDIERGRLLFDLFKKVFMKAIYLLP